MQGTVSPESISSYLGLHFFLRPVRVRTERGPFSSPAGSAQYGDLLGDFGAIRPGSQRVASVCQWEKLHRLGILW